MGRDDASSGLKNVRQHAARQDGVYARHNALEPSSNLSCRKSLQILQGLRHLRAVSKNDVEERVPLTGAACMASAMLLAREMWLPNGRSAKKSLAELSVFFKNLPLNCYFKSPPQMAGSNENDQKHIGPVARDGGNRIKKEFSIRHRLAILEASKVSTTPCRKEVSDRQGWSGGAVPPLGGATKERQDTILDCIHGLERAQAFFPAFFPPFFRRKS
jgi:hypothetical protein